MRQTPNHDFWIKLLLFLAAFGLTLAAANLTLAPGVGPGPAAAWAAESFGMGTGAGSVFSPLFRILAPLVQVVGPENTTLTRLNFFTATGHATLAGLVSLLLLPFFRKQEFWGAFSLALLGGVLVGVTRVGWASALLVTPGPWALAALAGAFLLLLPGENSANDRRRHLLSALVMGLAIVLHASLALLLPAWWFWGNRYGVSWKQRQGLLQVGFVLLPLLLFLSPLPEPVFNTAGLLIAAPGLPDYNGFHLLLWTAWHTLTPLGLLLALWGTYRAVRIQLAGAILIDLMLLAFLVMSFMGAATSQLAAMGLSVLIVLGAIYGAADLFDRLPGGPSLLLWLTIPALWWGHGLSVSRATLDGETFWETHCKNQVVTVRLNNLVLAEEDSTLIAPYYALTKAKKIRPDLAVINPLRLDRPGYLQFLEYAYAPRMQTVRGALDTLTQTVSSTQDTSEVKQAAERFLVQLIRREAKSNGVVLSPRYVERLEKADSTQWPALSRLLSEEFELIPEGLFYRVVTDGKPYPFHFSGLDMSEIAFDRELPLLRNRAVALYAEMFTRRGSWMLQREFVAEGREYVRWALKIAPDYTPAVLLARDYGISGPPQLLGK